MPCPGARLRRWRYVRIPELSRRTCSRFDSPYRLGGARCGMPLKNKCEVSILVLPATMNKLTLQWRNLHYQCMERKWP